MTEIILTKDLDNTKLKALLAFLKSWGIEAELKKTVTKTINTNSEFSLTAGLWSDYQLDSEELRKQAWQRK